MTDAQKKFITYIQKYVGQPYVWGGTGETLTASTYEAFIDKKEKTSGHNANAKSFCRKLFSQGKTSVTVFDCSGYISKALIAAGLRKGRRDCDGLWTACKRTYVPKDFTLLYRVSSTNAEDETHIGVYYQGYQYHAKGRAYGVVKEKYKASYWQKMGIYPGLSEVESTEGYAFRKLLKKPMYGSQDVKEMKKLLIAKGYTGISADNGNFLGSTEKAVKAFQEDKGLQVDGKAGKQTIQALGGIWQG